jgi:hypothetical protein
MNTTHHLVQISIVALVMALPVKERVEFRLCIVLSTMKWRAHRYEYDDEEEYAYDAMLFQRHHHRCILKLIVDYYHDVDIAPGDSG